MERFKFSDVKRIVADELYEIYGELDAEADRAVEDVLTCDDLNDLYAVLDSMGFNGYDAVDFVMSCLVDEEA